MKFVITWESYRILKKALFEGDDGSHWVEYY